MGFEEKERKEQDQKRTEANRVRQIRLGHITPDPAPESVVEEKVVSKPKSKSRSKRKTTTEG